MERVAVKSSQIVSVGWEADVLEVEFLNGTLYQYQNVDEKMHSALMAAPSVGGHFTQFIKKYPSAYPYKDVTPGGRGTTSPKWGEGDTAAGTAKVKTLPTEEIVGKVSPLPEKARKMVVVTGAHYLAAAEFLKGVKALREEINAAFDPIIAKAHEAHKEALSQKKRAEEPLVTAEGIVKQTIAGYLRNEEIRAQKEKARLEAKLQESVRRQAEDENLKHAQELADQGRMDEAAAAVDAPVTVPVIPVHVESRVPKVAGLSRRKTFKAEVRDMMKLVKAVAEGRAPLACLEPNMVFLNAQARAFKEAGPLLDNGFKPNMGVDIVETDGIAASSR